jgi:opacity protein-like surface antigen/outer membrane protein OmpA-like peptidoglycan-associated protein
MTFALVAGVSAQSNDWKGFYIGGNAGGVKGSSDSHIFTVFSPTGYFATTSVPAIAAIGRQKLSPRGFTGGGQLGYNFQHHHWLFGVEADFGVMHVSDDTVGSALYPCCAPTSFTIKQTLSNDWLFTARPRLGWGNNNVMVYGTGGLAMTNFNYTGLFIDTFAAANESAKISAMKVGWVLGGGVEFKVGSSKHWSLKGEYLLADWGLSNTTSTNLTAFPPVRIPFPTNVFFHQTDLQQHIFRAGFNYRFGHAPEPPPPPPANGPPVASCSANPNMVIAGSGDIVIVRASASDPDNDPLTYAWSATGGNVAGSGSEVRWASAGVAPGTYTVTASVNDGHGHTVNCSADIAVNPPPNRPPTMTCTASKNSVVSGEPVGILATASDPDGDPLSYSWSTSAGRITGSGASVTLDTSNAQGPVTVSGHVDDGRGGTADCQVGVDVRPRSLSLRSVYFVVGQPTKKNPDGGLLSSQQQTLQTVARDFKSYLSVKPDARLMLDGYADIRPYRGGHDNNDDLTQRRADRAKSYLVEQGVPAGNLDTNAHGVHKELTEAEVRALVEGSPELSAEEKARLLNKKNFHSIWLANNRRVDATLESTGQTSIQEYPFNAADALTLIGGREAEYVKKHPPKKAPAKRAPRKAAPKKAATKK